LEFSAANPIVQCPWHGWEFDLATGVALYGITVGRIRTYPVEVRGGVVYVTMKRRSDG
jgi:nitrite reductase/ring-hydroxylating ferredoxin subunit